MRGLSWLVGTLVATSLACGTADPAGDEQGAEGTEATEASGATASSDGGVETSSEEGSDTEDCSEAHSYTQAPFWVHGAFSDRPSFEGPCTASREMGANVFRCADGDEELEYWLSGPPENPELNAALDAAGPDVELRVATPYGNAGWGPWFGAIEVRAQGELVLRAFNWVPVQLNWFASAPSWEQAPSIAWGDCAPADDTCGGPATFRVGELSVNGLTAGEFSRVEGGDGVLIVGRVREMVNGMCAGEGESHNAAQWLWIHD